MRDHTALRALAILTVPFVLVLAACGDDDDGDAPAKTDDPSELQTLPGGVTLPEGVTVPDVTIPDLTLPEGVTIPDLTLPEGVTIPDLTLPEGVTIPDFGGSLPDMSALEPMLRAAWAQAGLNDEQIDCLIDHIDLSGGMPELEDAEDLLDECDIDPNTLVPGG